MPLHFGNQSIADAYLGSTALSSIYLGSTLVWSSTATQPPAYNKTLDYDFKQKWGSSIADAVNAGPTPAHTRGGSVDVGYDENGLLRTATADQPVYNHNPADNNLPLGLSVMPADTNYTLYSEDFTQWTTGNGSHTMDATGPDGVANSATTYFMSGPNPSTLDLDPGVTTTKVFVSAYAKYVSGDPWLRLFIRGASSGNDRCFTWFNLQTGTAGSLDGQGSGNANENGMIDVGNGWYFCWMRGTVGNWSAVTPRMQIALSPTDGMVSGDGNGSCNIYGHHFKYGSVDLYPTSYIKTTGAATTRNATDCSTTDMTWLTQGQGTFYSRSRRNIDTGIAQIFQSYGDGNNRIRTYYNTALIQHIMREGGINHATLNTSGALATTNRSALGYLPNDFAATSNGEPVVTDTDGNVPNMAAFLQLGNNSGTQFLNGTIAELRYFDDRMTNEELEALSLDGTEPEQGLYPYDMGLDFLQNWGTPIDDAIEVGPSSLTFSRADTVATAWDQRGVLRRAGTENSLLWSNRFRTVPEWGVTPSSSNQCDVIDDTHIAPDGTMTASTVGDSDAGQLERRNQLNIAKLGSEKNWVYSIYVRKTTGDAHYLCHRLGFGSTNQGIMFDSNTGTVTQDTIPGWSQVAGYGVEDVNADWWRVWMHCVDPGSNTTLNAYLHPAWDLDGSGTSNNAATGSKVFWGAQLEQGTTPGIYVETTTASVTAGQARFDHDPVDQLISGLYRPKGILIEGAATNICTYSEEFDAADWTANSNATVAPNDAVAPDGTTTADRISDLSAAGHQDQRNRISIPTTSVPYCFSVFVLKDEDETRFPEFQIVFNDSGSTGTSCWVQLNTKTGATIERSAGTADAFGVIDSGNYWRFWVTQVNDFRTHIDARIYPALTTTWGNAEVSTQGNIKCWGAQVEQSAYPTSYIATAASSVTRAGEDLTTTDVSWWLDNNPGSFLTEWIVDVVAIRNLTDRYLWRMFGPGQTRSNIATSRILRGGYNGQWADIPATETPESEFDGITPHRSLFAWDTNDGEHYKDGESKVTQNTLALTATAGTSFRIGHASGGASPFWGWIGRLNYWQERRTDGEDQTSLINSPSLHLDFAQAWGASLESCTKVGPQNLLTYTRADTVATGFDENGVLQTAGSNAPVFDHDPGNGNAPLGLVVEEARTNICLYSEEFDDATWEEVSSVAVTANNATAPDGTQSADRINDAASGSYSAVRQTMSISGNTDYCLSFFIKKEAAHTHFGAAYVRLHGSAAENYVFQFSAVDGNIAERTSGSATSNVGVIDAGDYWRFWIHMLDGAGNVFYELNFRPADSTTWGAGETSAIGDQHLWGMMLEQGTSPSSYIATTSASVTRAAVYCIAPNTASFGWMNGDISGTYYTHSEIYPNAEAGPDDRYALDWRPRDGGANGVQIRHYREPSNAAQAVITTDGTNGDIQSAGVFPELKAGVSYSAPNMVFYRNGVLAGSRSNLGTVARDGPPLLELGCISNGSRVLNGHFKEFRYYRQALPTADLQTLTTL